MDPSLKRRVFSRLDLPAPLAPMMARNSPGLTTPLTVTPNSEKREKGDQEGKGSPGL